MKKIWYQSTLNFAQHPNYEKALASHFDKVASPGTKVLLNGRTTAYGNTLDTLDVIGSPIVYHSVVAPAFIRSLLTAESNGADAFVVASFSEPILPELRSLANIPVVSMSEACFMAASMCAPKIGFVTLNRLVVPYIEKSIALHKWKDRVTGIHLIEGDVSEAELDVSFANPRPYLDRLVEGIRTAIAAGAQVIVPAEGVLGVMAAENGIREIDGVPIIDAIGTPIIFAEMAIALKERTGVAQSRASYPSPSAEARELLSANPSFQIR
ncbi:allantoin racemase [Paraburkholderia sacchari]|uniref:aspartate/glutamate racemase family protein n=1 Tax=Paraburkholderia sacchari TaxID=159450 RepID=UPI0039A6FCFE